MALPSIRGVQPLVDSQVFNGPSYSPIRRAAHRPAWVAHTLVLWKSSHNFVFTLEGGADLFFAFVTSFFGRGSMGVIVRSCGRSDSDERLAYHPGLAGRDSHNTPHQQTFSADFVKVGLTDLWPTVKGRRGRYHLAILEPNHSWAPVGEEVYVMSDAMT